MTDYEDEQEIKRLGDVVERLTERAETAERRLAEAGEEREESQALLRRVYLILANVGNQWPRRFSREGQALLCQLRDATGGYPGEARAALGEWKGG